MAKITRGFTGRNREHAKELPPGQHLVDGFPVLSAGPTPRITKQDWELFVHSGPGQTKKWTWQEFTNLPSTDITTDIHCVTSWSKLATRWRGVAMDVILDGVPAEHRFWMAHCYGGYTTNLQLDDLRDDKAWIAYAYDGNDLAPEHGGPARLLVPHLYFWKSAKWIRGFVLQDNDKPGFWEQNGYHLRGDPWREERYSRWF